ncbi:hypothetical protein EJ08DRAFT_369295 [Tothia fuscella]|uniref:Uncharacterized protein n=1 Tax=Tothia fuscella TaxID=1048955 RepID=A0A9P4TWF5_9PEZI|nr:hypothetical protein EJ08DRAFT_369295 [Tothia fuscella]
MWPGPHQQQLPPIQSQQQGQPQGQRQGQNLHLRPGVNPGNIWGGATAEEIAARNMALAGPLPFPHGLPNHMDAQLALGGAAPFPHRGEPDIGDEVTYVYRVARGGQVGIPNVAERELGRLQAHGLAPRPPQEAVRDAVERGVFGGGMQEQQTQEARQQQAQAPPGFQRLPNDPNGEWEPIPNELMEQRKPKEVINRQRNGEVEEEEVEDDLVRDADGFADWTESDSE